MSRREWWNFIIFRYRVLGPAMLTKECSWPPWPTTLKSTWSLQKSAPKLQRNTLKSSWSIFLSICNAFSARIPAWNSKKKLLHSHKESPLKRAYTKSILNEMRGCASATSVVCSAYLVQLSISISSNRLKCRSLLVTRMSLFSIAVDPMSKSNSSISFPFLLTWPFLSHRYLTHHK